MLYLKEMGFSHLKSNVYALEPRALEPETGYTIITAPSLFIFLHNIKFRALSPL